MSSLPAESDPPFQPAAKDAADAPQPRRVMLPILLFLVTCLSTFWAGATNWVPGEYLGSLDAARRAVIVGWEQGLLYMAAVLSILFAHEMGHFIATVLYRIPASYPFFIPMPLNPFGTMGAVIGMDGLRANRREMFDIGLAGPLAGLVVAIPVSIVGVYQLDFSGPDRGLAYDLPLLMRWILDWRQPPGYEPGAPVWSGDLNAWFAAGWVGLLITGLNMMPVSQLDGGHVIYTLFGRGGHWIARGFVFFAIAYVVFAQAYVWSVMLVLVILLGVDHPPTADDQVDLGWPRTLLGVASLTIPILCFPPRMFVAGLQ